MIGPISRPLAPAYLKGIQVPVPTQSVPRPVGQPSDPAAQISQEPLLSESEKAEPNPEDKAEAAQRDQEISELKRRDAEVRAHEQAHLAAAGQYARSGASFEFEVGPDGKRYAVGGEVGIDVSEAATPEQTVAKANIVRRAALAPARPSAQDRRVAAMASAMGSEARAEIAEEKREGDVENAPQASALGQPEAGHESSGELSGVDLIAQRAAALAGARAYQNRPDGPPKPRSPSGQPQGSIASLDIRL
jgi:hypothetical protein